MLPNLLVVSGLNENPIVSMAQEHRGILKRRRSKPFWSLSSKYRVVPRVADSISDTFYLSIAKNIDVIPKAFMTLTKFGVRVASV